MSFRYAPPRRVSQGLAFVAALLAAGPALAKKKREPPPSDTSSSSTSDPKLTAPPPDSMGRVHFGSASAAGTGRITVNGSAGDKIHVYLEGRYFGDAPVTIYSVPKGDYIVEGTTDNGKTISRPVSVTENEEAVADLAVAHVATKAEPGSMIATTEVSPERLKATKAFAIAGAGGLLVGAVFGVLMIMKEGEYRDAPNEMATLDDIRNTGETYALISNIGWAIAAVGVIGTAISGYPMFVKSEKKSTIASSGGRGTGLGLTSFAVAPGPGGGSLSLRW